MHVPGTQFSLRQGARGARLRRKDNHMAVTAQDIVNSASKLLEAPFRTWHEGMSIPLWLDDHMGDPPPVAHLKSVGVSASDLVNFALEDNELEAGGGLLSFADFLVRTSKFDPESPGQAGAIAFRPFESMDQPGHIAIYMNGHTLIQALPD